jgi:superfamily II DNA or RNA helicase
VTGDHFDEMREHFSVKNTNAFFMRKMGNKWAKERLYLMTPTGLFEIGMIYELLIWLKSAHPETEVIIDSELSKAAKPDTNVTEVYDKCSLKLRDFQFETVKKALQFGRGIIKIGTGGGKTLTTASLISSFWVKSSNIKCLLIVPDLGLVSQTFKDFESYNVPFTFTKWTGSIEPDLSRNVIIANLGILQSQYKETDWLKNIDLMVIDECHKLKKANKVNKLLAQIKTPHKFGLTGTLPDTKIDEWNIIGKLGRVFYEKSSFDLREEKYLTGVTVNILNVKYTNKEELDKIKNFRDELNFIHNSSYRNKMISAICQKFNNNILIMVNHIAHGNIIYDTLINSENIKDKKIYFIRGEVEVEERAKVIQEMEANNNVVCIAISAIFSTGVNIKNLHMIIFAAGGKSFIRTVQSIGRGLRLNSNKTRLSIIDIADKLEYGINHSIQRKETYNKEKIGYVETTVVEKQVS